jgi:hypothetical protein
MPISCASPRDARWSSSPTVSPHCWTAIRSW